MNTLDVELLYTQEYACLLDVGSASVGVFFIPSF